MNKHNTFLIAFAVILLFLGVYVYFDANLNVQAAAPTSSVASQSGASPLQAATTSNDQISVDTAFLLSLTSLTKLKIDTSLFDNIAFQRLNDNTVALEQVETGRPNPFAPIDAYTVGDGALASPVTTDAPVKIATKTAVLSGTIDSSTQVTNTYFEYGPTPTLGKVTPQATPSLIGTFVTTISGLTPKTTYFYRAVAKINGTPVYGEIVTFETQ